MTSRDRERPPSDEQAELLTLDPLSAEDGGQVLLDAAPRAGRKDARALSDRLGRLPPGERVLLTSPLGIPSTPRPEPSKPARPTICLVRAGAPGAGLVQIDAATGWRWSAILSGRGPG